jgi:hypothetical protein
MRGWLVHANRLLPEPLLWSEGRLPPRSRPAETQVEPAKKAVWMGRDQWLHTLVL